MIGNKKIVFWFLIFISSVLLDLILGFFNYEQPRTLKKPVAKENIKSEDLVYLGPTPILSGSVLLTRWFLDGQRTGIYTYNFDSGVKKFVDWSFGNKEIKFEKDRLIYKTDYNQISEINFLTGKREMIVLPGVEREKSSDYSALADFWLSGSDVFYFYDDVNGNSYNHSLKVYDRDSKETKLISNLNKIWGTGGIDRMFKIEGFNEGTNELSFVLIGGDVCFSFREYFKVDINTGEIAVLETKDLSSCPTDEDLLTPTPTEAEGKVRYLRSIDYCDDLKILNYDGVYPLEINKGNNKNVVSESYINPDFPNSKIRYVDYEFLGCVDY